MSVKAGRAAKISFSLAKADDINDDLATVAAKTYLHIGATRGKTKTASWSTADVTTADSPQYNQQSIVTFKEKTLSVDGIAYDDAAFNLKALGSAIEFPDAIAQGGEPYMWLKYETLLEGTRYLFGIATSWERGEPYDNGGTFSFEVTVMNELEGA